MPIVELHVLEGYGPNEKRRLHEALSDAVRLVIPAARDTVTVMINDMKGENYSRGGVARKGAAALPDPVDIVRTYLDAMEARDLPAAKSLLEDGFVMNFPGAPAMRTLEELIEWAGRRYRFVKKTYEGFDVAKGVRSAVLVYCRGTLSGEWPDGSAFNGIRFIDRFEIEDGKIMRQEVWNDIAETRAKA